MGASTILIDRPPLGPGTGSVYLLDAGRQDRQAPTLSLTIYIYIVYMSVPGLVQALPLEHGPPRVLVHVVVDRHHHVHVLLHNPHTHVSVMYLHACLLLLFIANMHSSRLMVHQMDMFLVCSSGGTSLAPSALPLRTRAFQNICGLG